MIITEVFMDILALHRQGYSMRWIAKKLGIHRNTVKKVHHGKKSSLITKCKESANRFLASFTKSSGGWLEQDNFRACPSGRRA